DSAWTHDFSSSNSWEIEYSGNLIATIDTMNVNVDWISPTLENGLLYISSSGALIEGENQKITCTLTSPVSLKNRKNIALVFEEFYKKNSCQTFIEFSTDSIEWEFIEINKEVSEGDSIKSLRPLRIEEIEGQDKVWLRFRYEGTSTLNEAIWIIDDIAFIQLPVIKIVPENESHHFCKGDSIKIIPKVVNKPSDTLLLEKMSFHWNENIIQPYLYVKTSQKISCTSLMPFSRFTSFSEREMESNIDSMEVERQDPFEEEEIFLVTVDTATGKNIVTWKKTEGFGTRFYYIYKGPINNEELIGIVSFTAPPVFLDYDSKPQSRSARYKITVVDTCGNESLYSPTHSTIHLTKFFHDDAVELKWSSYEGFEFDYYYVLAGHQPSSMKIIDSIPAHDELKYIDSTSLYEVKYYRIEVDKGEVYSPPGKKSNSGPFSRSLSNMEDNSQKVDFPLYLKNIPGNFQFEIFPNPYHEIVNISYSIQEPSEVNIVIFDLTGKKVATLVNTYQAPGSWSYQFSPNDFGYPAGMFFVKTRINDQVFSQKIIQVK
ncbi:MAG: T9SS type A sorting domain-containing protein, partial [bacterium]